MIITNFEDLLALDETDYPQVELINCYIKTYDFAKCKEIVKKLKHTKIGLVKTVKEIVINFGEPNYLSKDKKTLVIGNLEVCKKNCQNCVSCLNMEFLSENYNIDTLIINKIGIGGNVILNNLSDSIKKLRVGESEEPYELNNLPYGLEMLELFDNKYIDVEKIKLPFNCKFNLTNKIIEKPIVDDVQAVLAPHIVALE
jgi:hypothetical protein